MLMASVAHAQDAADARLECSVDGRSHPEIRACLKSKADSSLNELHQIEDAMRKALMAWDQDQEVVKRSTNNFESSVKEFVQYRDQQCEFIASLAAGGNSQGDLRYSCGYEMNQKRIDEVKQAINFIK